MRKIFAEAGNESPKVNKMARSAIANDSRSRQNRRLTLLIALMEQMSVIAVKVGSSPGKSPNR